MQAYDSNKTQNQSYAMWPDTVVNPDQSYENFYVQYTDVSMSVDANGLLMWTHIETKYADVIPYFNGVAQQAITFEDFVQRSVNPSPAFTYSTPAPVAERVFTSQPPVLLDYYNAVVEGATNGTTMNFGQTGEISPMCTAYLLMKAVAVEGITAAQATAAVAAAGEQSALLTTYYNQGVSTTPGDGKIQLSGFLLNELSNGTTKIDGAVPPPDHNTDGNTVYRFLNNATGAHFYTGDVAEMQLVRDTMPSFSFEGGVFKTVESTASDKVDLFRFLNQSNGTHFYTASVEEAQIVRDTMPAFKYEDVAYQGHETKVAGSTELYRYLNTSSGSHFYTSDPSENQYVQTEMIGVMKYEGIVCYVDTI